MQVAPPGENYVIVFVLHSHCTTLQLADAAVYKVKLVNYYSVYSFSRYLLIYLFIH